jgi:hypothetical protein
MPRKLSSPSRPLNNGLLPIHRHHGDIIEDFDTDLSPEDVSGFSVAIPNVDRRHTLASNGTAEFNHCAAVYFRDGSTEAEGEKSEPAVHSDTAPRDETADI